MSAAAALRAVADRAARLAADWPGDAATNVVGATVTRSLNAATGGDGALSRGRNLGRATVRVDTGRAAATVAASGSATVWRIVEDGTGRHIVRARRGRTLATPYGPRRAVVVSGVKPRHAFSDAAADALPRVALDVVRRFGQVVG